MASNPQPQASSSASRWTNPQLGPEPSFDYPTPGVEELEDELPPYFEGENVGLGPVLEGLVKKGHGDLRVLVERTLPPLAMTKRPREIIQYAKHTRQAVLKYLAILRWKTSVDVATSAPILTINNAAASFPTPQTNGDSNDTSPAALGYLGKGKGKMVEEDVKPLKRGRVTDAKRITHFMEHQNRQHELTIEHLKHVTKGIETLRYRNADLLTSISLLTLGTYDGLPTNLTEPFIEKPLLTNRSVLMTLRRLDAHILYRLRCIDYLPPELSIHQVIDGWAYLVGGGEHGWKAQITVGGFGQGEEGSRWWLTGLEWGWRVKEKGVDDPGGGKKKFEGDERQQILDVVNVEILPPRKVEGVAKTVTARMEPTATGTSQHLAEDGNTKVEELEGTVAEVEHVDAPLVRLYNILEHLSLSYQLEVLCEQAFALSQGKWRGQLIVEMDREKKLLRLKYWIRPRPAQAAQQQAQAAVGKRAPVPPSQGAARPVLVGGILSISLEESTEAEDEATILMRDVSFAGRMTAERTVMLGLRVRWEIGEAGVGGGLAVGDAMNGDELAIDSTSLSLDDVLTTATRTHASHLTKHFTAPLLLNHRLSLFPSSPPTLVESDSPIRPLALHLPLPSRQQDSQLIISVSARTGLVEIEDAGATSGSGSGDRASRAKLATSAVNERGRLFEDVGRLLVAVITENLETQMRQLGWQPTRRLPLRSPDLAKHDLHPASTIFVPLPTSSLHYFTIRVTPSGIVFELVKLTRVLAESGFGMRLVIGDRTGVDLVKIRERRLGAEQAGLGKRERRISEDNVIVEDVGAGAAKVTPTDEAARARFQIENRELQDVYTFSNALVAQTIVEQQLKDRAIPHTLQYPPTSGPGAPKSKSAVAGMIPTLVVNARDLLKDGRASDVARPKVFMQIKDWWKSGQCSVVTIVHLQHKPALSSAASASPTTSAKSEGITFDPASSIVTFTAQDISRCVPAFLEQWERLSKVIVVAGEVNRLNKISAFSDLKMLDFDLRSATLRYKEGYCASITYTPQSDSYQVGFFTDQPGGINPHEKIGGLLSWRLNELTLGNSAGNEEVGKKDRNKDVGRKWISLLRNTLPFLLAVDEVVGKTEKEYPKFVISAVDRYRLVWDRERENKRFSLDVVLAPREKFLFTDGSEGDDPSCGIITPITGFAEVVGRVWEDVRDRCRGVIPGSAAGAEGGEGERGEQVGRGGTGEGGGREEREEGKGQGGERQAPTEGKDKQKRKGTGEGKKGKALASRMSHDHGLLCEVEVVGEVVSGFVREIELVIGGSG